uniref:Uncharacterized protein n=1 Tax=Meloidogyne enterolobii TaxID=390850 RepID=A0A6V7UVR2_MELEN|nr:unnamed protein product [Meloidogyne enterolobii]
MLIVVFVVSPLFSSPFIFVVSLLLLFSSAAATFISSGFCFKLQSCIPCPNIKLCCRSINF